jgi:hypothetical protein
MPISDPSWEILPVADPALPEGRRRRLSRDSLATTQAIRAESRYQRRHRDQVVVPAALDRVSRGLLIRAQDAVGSALQPVTSEEAGSPGFVAEPALRMHEWQIALALRDITALRAEHESRASASAGPMTDSVLGPQRRALELAQAAIEARVAALERYAAEILAARSAFRDWQDALQISDLNGSYLDLLARTAAHEHAVTEISGLTDQAAAAAQALRESMRQVGLAAAALVLPDPAPVQREAGPLSPSRTVLKLCPECQGSRRRGSRGWRPGCRLFGHPILQVPGQSDLRAGRDRGQDLYERYRQPSSGH